MQVFTTDARTYINNEFKSWGWTLAISALLIFVFNYFLSFPLEKILIGVAVLILLKAADTLTQFHVKQIQIDTHRDQLTFILSSKLSGQKIKTYNLHKVKSELIGTSTSTKTLNSPITLEIYLSNKESFRIDSRYGFLSDSLIEVDNAIKTNNNF